MGPGLQTPGVRWEQAARGRSLLSSRCQHLTVSHIPGRGGSQQRLGPCRHEYFMAPRTMKRCSREERGGEPHVQGAASTWPGCSWFSPQAGVCSSNLLGQREELNLDASQASPQTRGGDHAATPIPWMHPAKGLCAEARLSPQLPLSSHFFKHFNPSKGLKQLYFLKYSWLPAPPARSCQHPELTQPRGAAGGVLKATHPHPLLQHPMSTGTKEQSFHTSVPLARWGFSQVSCYG